MVAEMAGIHSNTVLAWCNERNAPSPQHLTWFFQALSKHSGVPYMNIWIHWVYHISGEKDAYQKSKGWIQSSEHQNQEANDEEKSRQTAESNLRK
jgi:hypothetical protein